MTSFSDKYKATASIAARNVVSKVMPINEMPQNLLEAYEDLAKPLLADEDGFFIYAWTNLPISAQNLLEQAQFHGFFIGQAWLRLSMAGQEIAELANTGDAIDEKEYQGVFARLIEDALKDSLKKLKKARTDKAILNGFKRAIA